MQIPLAEKPTSKWYQDWQAQSHAGLFDARSALPPRSLARNYESFSDVRILGEYLAHGVRGTTLLEVGCATGEFRRYLKLRYPGVAYCGVDISQPAITRAKEKYPEGRFCVTRPDRPLREEMAALGLPERPEILYSKDVVHHQTDPFGFLAQLLEIPSSLLVLRTRTRDQGASVLDPELSCQYHYRGWMPYLVFNVEELIGQILRSAPDCELVLYRNRMVLGGAENRFLPKECYLPETGTAETAVGVFLKTDHPRRVQVTDRADGGARHPLADRIILRAKRMLRRR